MHDVHTPPRDAAHIASMEQILQTWTQDPDLVIFSGDWSNGSVVELLPRGRATLTPPRYAGPFAGLRDLRIEGTGHHVHLDLARLTHAWYRVAPSVCYAFRPSLELRLLAVDGDAARNFSVGFCVGNPYSGDRLRAAAGDRYFGRVTEHLRMHAGLVSFSCEQEACSAPGDWQPLAGFLRDRPQFDALRAHLPFRTELCGRGMRQ